jgi:hypothetical protein
MLDSALLPYYGISRHCGIAAKLVEASRVAPRSSNLACIHCDSSNGQVPFYLFRLIVSVVYDCAHLRVQGILRNGQQRFDGQAPDMSSQVLL